MPSPTDGVFSENCVFNNLYSIIYVYINGTLVNTSENLSNYTSYELPKAHVNETKVI